MVRNGLIKQLRALLWALLACVGEVVAGDHASTPVRLFYNQDSQELRNLIEGLKKAGQDNITLTNSVSPDVCAQPGKIISFGGDITEMLVAACPNTDLVFIGSNFYYAKFKSKLTKGSWGYFNEQPLLKQLMHADRNMPSIKTLGVLYKDNDGDINQIQGLLKANTRIQVKLVKIESGQVIAQVLRSLYEQVDAVLVTSNQEIWSLQDFKTYLLLGMRQGKLMIGGHSQFFINRGVISSVHNDYIALGEQMGKELTEDHHEQIRYFDKTNIVTNQMLTARYGIYIGDKKE
ncbi:MULTISPECIES: hypothetical protein [Pseudomonas]|uniref:hypothetical protein n=1 Tax=Pseudomonas TaxID=286 RepID=UPI000F021ACE|nr:MULTISPECIES: hypothetical protein [Pseudomonas]MBD8614981.1 hypothetical protein [Pseudomonas putida]MBD8681336.1 hypothetical protein [Pseudomonas sp. CFBP 13719]